MFIPGSVPPTSLTLLNLADINPGRAVIQANQVLSQIAINSPQAKAWALYTLGWALFRWERLGEAIPYFEQALSWFRQADDQRGQLHCRAGLLFVDWMSGKGRSLQPEWQYLVRQYQILGDDQAVLQLRIYQAAHLNMLGESALSIAQLSKLATLSASTMDAGSLARLRRILGVAYLNLGDSQAAHHQYRLSIQTFRSLKWQPEIAKCLFEQARLAEHKGQHNAAMTILQKASDLAAQHELVMLKPQCDKLLGLIYSRLGHYRQAIEMLVAARSLFIFNKRQDQAAQCDHNLGIIFYYYGLFDFSQAFYRRAQNIYQSLDKIHDLLIVQRNQALILRKQGHTEAALQLLYTLAESAQNSNNLNELAHILQAQAQCWNDQGNHAKALESIQQAYQYFVTMQHPDAIGECLLDYATTALLLEDIAEARQYFQRAKRLLSKRPMYAWLAIYGLGRCAQTQGQLSRARSYYQKAQSIVLNMRRSVPSEHASSGFFSQAQALYIDSLSATIALETPAAVLELVEQQRALTLQQYLDQPAVHIPLNLREIHQQRRATLQQLLNAAAPDSNIHDALQEYLLLILELRHIGHRTPSTIYQPFDLNQIRQQFNRAYGNDWVALIYSFYGEQLLIFGLTTTTLTMSQIALNKPYINLLKQLSKPEYRDFTYDDYAYAHGRSSERWSVLNQAQALLLPSQILQLSHPNQRLLIIPDGCLHALPWAALHYQSKRLCQQAILQYIPSLQSMTIIEQPKQHQSLLFIGCTFPESAYSLFHIPDELAHIQRHWQQPMHVLLDQTASRQNILHPTEQTNLANYSHIHIATHGRMTSQQGLLAHIKLDDGDLFYDEIMQLQLTGALVILSVCQGAEGDVLPGDEVLSLSRAFLAAGAATVICHLWWVDDSLAVEMMDRLYQQLVLGYDASTALAHAQRQWINEQTDSTVEQSSALWSGWSVIEIGASSK